MRVNGQEIPLEHPQSLEVFLLDLGYQIGRIAVELNAQIVPRDQFAQVQLKDDDVIEVLTFMGGG